MTPKDDKDSDRTVDLIFKARDGDDDAMNLLLQKHIDRILLIVRMRLSPHLRSRLDSMDIVQGVLLRVANYLKDFEPKSDAAFIHWVGKLVRNEICDAADHHGAGKRDMNREAANERLSQIVRQHAEEPISLRLARLKEYEKLQSALDRLPEKQRDVVIMREYEGLTFREIAAELGVSEDAARMQYGRSIDRLIGLFTSTS